MLASDAIILSRDGHIVLNTVEHLVRMSCMLIPNEYPAVIETVFRCLCAFLQLQENVQNTTQLNWKSSKTLRTCVYRIYSDCTSVIQSVEIASQSVSPYRLVAFDDMAFKELFAAAQ